MNKQVAPLLTMAASTARQLTASHAAVGSSSSNTTSGLKKTFMMSVIEQKHYVFFQELIY